MSGAGLAWIGPALGRRAQSSTARRWTGYTTSSWLRRGGCRSTPGWFRSYEARMRVLGPTAGIRPIPLDRGPGDDAW